MKTYHVTVRSGAGRKVAEGTVPITDPKEAVHVISAGMTVCASAGRDYPRPARIEVRTPGLVRRYVTEVSDR